MQPFFNRNKKKSQSYKLFVLKLKNKLDLGIELFHFVSVFFDTSKNSFGRKSEKRRFICYCEVHVLIFVIQEWEL
jgi:hypothetical protein